METKKSEENPKQVFFQGSLDSPLSSCIVIASHLTKQHRIKYLMECLDSLFQQTLVIPIYLSFSFENDEINQEFAKEFVSRPYLHNDFLYLYPQESKTAQMQHIFQLYPILKERYHWLFFCDDDDTYEPKRVETFLQNIQYCISNYETPEKKFQGIYEQQHNAVHRQRRHEYWCYCINMRFFDKFYLVLLDYPDIVENKCCDVLFAEFIRRHDDTHLFACLPEKLYNYRRTDNSDSITGYIQETNRKIRPARTGTDANREECAKELNDYLDDNIEYYLSDTFLYSITGQPFDNILKSEFKSEYCIVDLIKPCHIDKMRNKYDYLLKVCNKLYDIPIYTSEYLNPHPVGVLDTNL